MKPNVSPIASGPSDDMLCRLLNSHHRTVDAEIIILRNPPISAGIGVIVFFSLFINFSDGVLRFFWPEALDLHPASDTIPKGAQMNRLITGMPADLRMASAHRPTIMQGSFWASSKITWLCISNRMSSAGWPFRT